MKKWYEKILEKYEGEDHQIKRKAQILLLVNIFAMTIVLFQGIVMFFTKAYTVSALCSIMIGVHLLITVLLIYKKVTLASNIFIYLLFTVMFLSIKFDDYVNAYETYVFAALGLVLLIISSLISFGTKQTRMVIFLVLLGTIALWLIDILPANNYKIDTLQIQNITTSLILILVGGFAGIILVKIQNNLVLLTESERDKIKNMLSMTEIYTKKSLVSIIAEGKDPTKFSPEEKMTAILFCDVRNFTDFSEKMKPIDIVGFLNSFFTRMNIVIQTFNGEIDKLIGDCIMASFEDINNALNCSIEMKNSMQKYNRDRAAYGLMPIQTGIGISYGPVIIGNIGSQSKMDFTVIGDIVNCSARLESLTKTYGLNILTSVKPEHHYETFDHHRHIDKIRVKGKHDSIDIYELFGHEPDYIKKFKTETLSAYQEAYSHYKKGDFINAEKLYGELINRAGNHKYIPGLCLDPVLNFYSGRCFELNRLVNTGLMSIDEWDGIYSFLLK